VIDGEKYLGRLKGAFVSHLFSYRNSQKIKASTNPQQSTSLSNSLHLTQHPKGRVAATFSSSPPPLMTAPNPKSPYQHHPLN
jgi:hypothetical protein